MSVFTSIDDDEAALGDLLSVELFTKIATNLNYLIDSVPAGEIAAILYGLPGVPAPDPKYWQECDGSAITEEASPLRGGNTPDAATAGRYLRGYDSIGNVGTTSGSNTKDLSHSHGGATGIIAGIDPEEFHTDADNDQFNSTPYHTHTIASDLSAAQNFEPVHIRVRLYLKIQ